MPLDWKPVQPPRPMTHRGRFVTLEPLDADRHSASLWKAVRGHDEVWTWLADGPYASESALHAALAEKQASQDAVFLAILPAPEAQGPVSPDVPGPSVSSPHPAAGYASYMRIEPAHGVVEVGNILLSPGLQRTTAATEAMYLMARHVFDDLGYRRYEWKCNAENEPSRRAALRLGFSFEGIFRQHMVIKDRNRDTAWFAMLDHEWPERKQAFERWLDPANFVAERKQKYKLAAFLQSRRP
jgi:RimJ/RimL family protein N-acetyltransferase